MAFRLIGLSILGVLVLSACAEMDDSMQTQQVVSTVVLDEETSQEFVIELAYTDAVTYEEAVVLVNNIAVDHDSGVTLADDVPASILEQADGILYENPRYNDLSDHVFQVRVSGTDVSLVDIIDQYHWEWIDRDIIEFAKHCPPGH